MKSESGTEEIGKLSGLKIFFGGGDGVEESEPKLPNSFNTALAKPLDYFKLLFKPDMFEEIVTNANHCVEYIHDLNNPNFQDKYFHEPCTVPEMRALEQLV